MNRVRLIVRSCKCRALGRGVDACGFRPDQAKDSSGCMWRASLMHPLDEPEGLQALVSPDLPGSFEDTLT